MDDETACYHDEKGVRMLTFFVRASPDGLYSETWEGGFIENSLQNIILDSCYNFVPTLYKLVTFYDSFLSTKWVN